MLAAKRPGIFVGWGARHVADDIARIAELLGAPVATTLQGLSAFPADHPLHTGMGFGPSAVPAAQQAFEACDAMLAVGTRFAEISTGSFGAVPPEQLVHIDINPDTIGANHPTTVAIAADARDAVPALAELLATRTLADDLAPLAAEIAAAKRAYRDSWLAHDSGGRVNPARFFDALRAALADDAIVVADDGNHTFLTAELLPMHRGGLFLSPTDFNCMGYCVPASIAAKLAQPQRQVVGIVGDGAFLMTGMEALTAVGRGLGVAWFVFNDGALAQIAQAQEIPYQRRSCTDLAPLELPGLRAGGAAALMCWPKTMDRGRGSAAGHGLAGQGAGTGGCAHRLFAQNAIYRGGGQDQPGALRYPQQTAFRGPRAVAQSPRRPRRLSHTSHLWQQPPCGSDPRSRLEVRRTKNASPL